MIKCKEFVVDGYNGDKQEVRASLVADTSAEVVAIGNDATTVIGLSDDSELAFGSTCLTVGGDFGTLDSTGAWRF